MTKSYQSLLDLNPVTTDAENFAGWTAEAMLAHMNEERLALPTGHDARNYVDAHWRGAMLAIDMAGPSAGTHLDLPAERERGRVDTIRVVLTVIHWLIAVRQNADKPRNLLPRFPDLPQPREKPLFKVAPSAVLDINAWCAERIEALLNTSHVRIVQHEGRARLRIRPGTFAAAELKVCRQWTRNIVDFIEGSFIDADEDGLRGLMRAA